jgi:hypothetical protein
MRELIRKLKKAVIPMEALRLFLVSRFPSLELPKQVRRVSPPPYTAETLSSLSSPSNFFYVFILKDLKYVNPSTPQHKCWGLLWVDPERGLAPPNGSTLLNLACYSY